MKVVNLRDRSFEQIAAGYCSVTGTTDLLRWDRTCKQSTPTVYTDVFLEDGIANLAGDKIAWLLEPFAVSPQLYDWILKNHRLFVEVWSHDDQTLSAIDNGLYVPLGGCRIDEWDQRVWPKEKLVSFFASNKDHTAGHKLRQKIRAVLPSYVSDYGLGDRFLDRVVDGLAPYAYSITVENDWRDSWFCERLICCFRTGAVPIYWGSREIYRFFDPRGVIHFQTVEELLSILSSLSLDDYASRHVAIEKNFEAAKHLRCPEHWIATHSKALREK